MKYSYCLYLPMLNAQSSIYTFIFRLEEFDTRNSSQCNAKIRDIVSKSTGILRLPTNAKILAQRWEEKPPSPDDFLNSQNRFLIPHHRKNSTSSVHHGVPVALVICQREVQPLTKAMEQEAMKASSESGTSPDVSIGKKVYDFNRDVWSQVDNLKKAVEDCLYVLTYQQYQQDVGITEAEAAVEGLEDIDDDDPNFYAFGFEDVEVVQKKAAKRTQMYSEPCAYRFRCSKGKQCSYKHSELEKEYFRMEPNTKKRFMYKTQQCLHTACKHIGKKYLCSFAHGMGDARCSNCGKEGIHWSDECLLRRE